MTTSAPYFTCKHGKTDGEPCAECLIAWSEWCIKSDRESIAKHERKIEQLKARPEAEGNPVVSPAEAPSE